MKFLMLATAALMGATPAVAATNANFVGPRVELNAGLQDVTRIPNRGDFVYGATLGADAPVGDRATIGIEANVDNVFDRDRTIGASARLGYAVNSTTLVYGKAGYANYRDVFSRKLDGLRVGGGVQFALSPNTFAKAEYRYTDFESGVGAHGGVVGVGIRF